MELPSEKEASKRLLGRVTAEERDAIRRLHERKNGLLELFRAIPEIDRVEDGRLYEKLVQDMSDTTAKYQGWFDAMSAKYEWDNIPGYSWEIAFDRCEVSLKKESAVKPGGVLSES